MEILDNEIDSPDGPWEYAKEVARVVTGGRLNRREEKNQRWVSDRVFKFTAMSMRPKRSIA